MVLPSPQAAVGVCVEINWHRPNPTATGKSKRKRKRRILPVKSAHTIMKENRRFVALRKAAENVLGFAYSLLIAGGVFYMMFMPEYLAKRYWLHLIATSVAAMLVVVIIGFIRKHRKVLKALIKPIIFTPLVCGQYLLSEYANVFYDMYYANQAKRDCNIMVVMLKNSNIKCLARDMGDGTYVVWGRYLKETQMPQEKLLDEYQVVLFE